MNKSVECIKHWQMRLCTHEREKGGTESEMEMDRGREGGRKPGRLDKIMSPKVLCQHILLLVQIPEVSSRF